jgi:mannose-1-phosphate guanylyltransferase
MRIAVVMAGGSGERFWPASRPERPKQLLRLTHPSLTMLEEAVERIVPFVGRENVFVATTVGLAGPIRSFGAVQPNRVLVEPMRRNTLGALCWVVASLLAGGQGDSTVAVLTADHLIGDPQEFLATVDAALEAAETLDALVTIGIPPTRPEIGYGYIEVDADEGRTSTNGRKILPTLRFREKPNLTLAQDFLNAGTFLWNSGMFFFTVPTFLRELEQAQPAVRLIVDRIAEALRKDDTLSAESAYEELPNISIDYALMEKAERVFLTPGNFPWDDVGAWDALARSFPTDDAGNVAIGESLLLDTNDCVVVNEDSGTTVALLGVRNLVVVNTPDAILVCDKDRAQEVRRIVAEINATN